MMKFFLKYKIPDKWLPNKENKKKLKNQKNRIIAKIERKAIYPKAKIALPLIGFSKKNTASFKYMINLHTFSRNTFLSLVEKKSE